MADFWGQAAQGYNIGRDLADSAQRKKNAQLEYKARKQEIDLAQNKQQAVSDAYGVLKDELAANKKKLRGIETERARNVAVQYASGTDKKDVTLIKNTLDSDEELAQNVKYKPEAGLKLPAIRDEDGNKTEDYDRVYNWLSAQGAEGVDWGSLNEQEADDIVRMVANSGQILFNGATTLDMGEFLITSGAYSKATGESRRAIEAQNEELKNKITGTFSAAKERNEAAIFKRETELKAERKVIADHILGLTPKAAKEGEDATVGIPNLIQLNAYDSMIKAEEAKGDEADPEVLKNLKLKREMVQRAEDKESGGAAYAAKQIKFRKEIARAEENPKYDGEVEDLKYFNTVQLKDKDKRFEEVQASVKTAEDFIEASDRIDAILGEVKIERDAISNFSAKINQLLPDDATKGIMQYFGSKDPEKRKEAKLAQAAFDRIETAIGYPMVRLIKEISGAAVTNEEREYLLGLVMGGTWQNMASLTEKLDEFRNGRIKDANKMLNKDVTGGKALRPQWASNKEEYLTSNLTSGKVGSTIKKLAKKKTVELPRIGETYKGQKITNRNPATGQLKLANGEIVNYEEQ